MTNIPLPKFDKTCQAIEVKMDAMVENIDTKLNAMVQRTEAQNKDLISEMRNTQRWLIAAPLIVSIFMLGAIVATDRLNSSQQREALNILAGNVNSTHEKSQ